jgi:hypothetical protein
MGTVGVRLKAKAQSLTDARRALAGTNDPLEHRQIISKLHDSITAADQPAATDTRPPLSSFDRK